MGDTLIQRLAQGAVVGMVIGGFAGFCIGLGVGHQWFCSCVKRPAEDPNGGKDG